MKYCHRCILPDTRPGIRLDDTGLCTACQGHDQKVGRGDPRWAIDWDARREKLVALASQAHARAAKMGSYDCIVPISGGKDSWFQVITAQRLGLRVLGVTWRTPARTAIGQQNLDALITRLGVDHIDYTIDPDVERRFMKQAFVRKGIPGLPMHMALFAIPIRLATQMRIPLIVWGENPQLEYGGERAERLATVLDRAWLSQHGCLHSTQANDWVGPGECPDGSDALTARDLIAYQMPPAGDFAPMSIFLGAYLRWDSFENARVAAEHGFVCHKGHLKTGTWHFADIDCGFVSVHHALKWLKFGITRAFDNLSVQIRYGRTTRAQAIETLRALGPDPPTADIEAFCAFVGETPSWFWQVAERFRNRDLWSQRRGTWIIEDFLIEDWPWS